MTILILTCTQPNGLNCKNKPSSRQPQDGCKRFPPFENFFYKEELAFFLYLKGKVNLLLYCKLSFILFNRKEIEKGGRRIRTRMRNRKKKRMRKRERKRKQTRMRKRMKNIISKRITKRMSLRRPATRLEENTRPRFTLSAVLSSTSATSCHLDMCKSPP